MPFSFFFLGNIQNVFARPVTCLEKEMIIKVGNRQLCRSFMFPIILYLASSLTTGSKRPKQYFSYLKLPAVPSYVLKRS